MPDRSLVADSAEVAAIAKAIAGSALAAFDLEFLAQDRLVPTLCLVQVAWLPHDVALDAPTATIVARAPDVALIDPLAVDARPVIEALAAHPRTVAHAPRQDLQLLATRFGVEMPRIADTQIMAAFAGLGDQIGFAALANELLGTSLGKEQQWTDWAQRPLSPAQLSYAESDVIHLPALFALLREKLGERMPWALAESSEISVDAIAATKVTAETAWLSVSTRGMDPPAVAALIELAAWRYRTAVALDKPIGQVINEKLLGDLARIRPDDVDELRSMKAVSKVARQRAEEIIEAIGNAKLSDVPPRSASKGAPSPRAARWAELLLAITQLVSERTGVASRLLAPRADAEEFARTVDEKGLDAAKSLPALATWRKEVLGDAWVGFLTGTLAIVGDVNAPGGLQLR
ncbi:MAG TPA: HRDC domain-containing protein [Kofleriaceae bacterium]